MGRRKWRKPKYHHSTWHESGQETQSDLNETCSDPTVFAEVESLFKKQFTYTPPEGSGVGWALPSADALYGEEHWPVEELQKEKKLLNDVKSSLSHIDIEKWHKHTQFTNRAGSVINHVRRTQRPEMCTQAWCKFHEIVASFPVLLPGVPCILPASGPKDVAAGAQFRSAHLCEAPGAFIASLNHFLQIRDYCGAWQWVANTLNPYYEGNDLRQMITDDRLILDTLDRWHFGPDDSGDIRRAANIDGLQAHVAQTGPVHLVTCDGSVDCQDRPGDQEELVAPLHHAEVTASLLLLAPGGTLVLKMFTMFESSSVCMLYLLNCLFTTVHVFKPATSKAGNSEVYVVCIGYKGCDPSLTERLLQATVAKSVERTSSSMFSFEDIPKTFLTQHVQCCQYFLRLQVQTIEENLSLFSSLSAERRLHLAAVKQHCAASFVTRFLLCPLPGHAYLVPPFHTQQPGSHGWSGHHQVCARRYHTGSYVERQTRLHLSWSERVQGACFYGPLPRMPGLLQGTCVLEREEMQSWKTVVGHVPERVVSSQFCNPGVLQWYNELLLHHKNEKKSTFDYTVLRDCIESICTSAMDEGQEQHSVKVIQLDPLAGPFLQYLSNSQQFKLCADRGTDGETLLVSEFGAGEGLGHSWSQSNTQLLCSLCTMYTSARMGDACVLLLPDLLSRLSANILYLFYMSFNQVDVSLVAEDGMAPIAVVGAGYRCEQPECALTWLNAATSTVTSVSRENQRDILQIIPVHVLFEAHFHDYVCEVNETLLKLRSDTMLRQQQLEQATQRTHLHTQSETPEGTPSLQPETPEGAPSLQPETPEGVPSLQPETPEGTPSLQPETPEGSPSLQPETPEGAPSLQPEIPEGAPSLQL